MVEIIRYHCKECGYFWEFTSKQNLPKECPECGSNKIHRAAGDRRFSKKARPKVRRGYSGTLRR